LRAAKNLARPTLDLVSNYQVNGFGDDLLRYKDDDTVGTGQGFGSAYETLTAGEQTGWNLGFEFTWRMGLRSELAQIRNIELRLVKARAYLAAKELDIGHELSLAIQQMARAKQTAQTYLNREIANAQQVKLIKEEIASPLYTPSPEGVDLRLRADISLRDARIAYFNSLVAYNKALAEVEYRKGTLLDYDNVHLAEGMWTPRSYADAIRRAWARSHAIDAHHVHPEPEPIVSDGYQELQLYSPDDSASPGVYELKDIPPAPTAERPDLSIPDLSVDDQSMTFAEDISAETSDGDKDEVSDEEHKPTERGVSEVGQQSSNSSEGLLPASHVPATFESVGEVGADLESDAGQPGPSGTKDIDAGAELWGEEGWSTVE